MKRRGFFTKLALSVLAAPSIVKATDNAQCHVSEQTRIPAVQALGFRHRDDLPLSAQQSITTSSTTCNDDYQYWVKSIRG